MTKQAMIRRGVLVAAGAAVLGSGFFTGVHGTTVAHAAGPVAKYVMTPTPIGNPATVGPNRTVNVTVIAQDATGVAVPSSPIYLAFDATSAGGSAKVGATVLGKKSQVFGSDVNGVVTVAFTTPAVMPASGTDVLRAENAATKPTSTIVAKDTFDYGTITGLVFSPDPIAKKGTLPGGAVTQVTLAVTKGAAQPDPRAVVFLTFKQTTGGGTATVNGTPLTATPTAITADSAGLVHIVYTTPTVRPSGADAIVAGDSATHPGVVARDRYAF